VSEEKPDAPLARPDIGALSEGILVVVFAAFRLAEKVNMLAINGIESD